MKRVVISIAVVFASLYLGVAGVLYAYQRDFLYFPDMQRPIAGLAGVLALRSSSSPRTDFGFSPGIFRRRRESRC